MSRAGRTEQTQQTKAFQTGDNHLLVIGINQYADSSIPNLRNARKDAEAVAQLLQDNYGFDTNCCKTLFDKQANHESITDLLEALPNRIQPEDNLLIYFAGHGHYNKITRIGYLLPADARWGKPNSYIPHSTLLDYIRAIQSRHTFLIVDSCFSGALFRNVDDTHRAAANLERLPSRWGLAAGLIEEVSDGFYNDNSPFAKALLTYLQTAPDTFLASDLIQHVKNAVPNNATQQPFGGILQKVGDQQGEMVFRRNSSEELDWQQQAWDKVNKNSITALVQFIREHRENTYVADAEKRIAELEKGYMNKIETPVLPKESKPLPTKSAENYFNEAREKWDEKDYKTVIELCTKAIELNPNYAEAYSRRGAAKNELGHYENALTDHNKAIQINPQYADAYFHRAKTKNNLNDSLGSVVDYVKAYDLKPKDAQIYLHYGDMKVNVKFDTLKDYSGAVVDYTKAIELNPKYGLAYNNRGVAYQALGKLDLACQDWRKAIEVGNSDAADNLKKYCQGK